jgi:hypothetical protein
MFRRPIFAVLFIVTCCAIVGSATVADAAMANATGSVAGCITYNRTANVDGTNLDQVDFYLTNVPAVATGYKLQILEGTWAASGVANAGIALVQSYYYAGKSPVYYTDWTQFTGVTFPHQLASVSTYPSYVNFEVVNNPSGAAPDFFNEHATGQTVSGVPTFADFSGSWFTFVSKLGAGDLLATIFVTHGADVSFTAHGGNPGSYLYDRGWGWSNAISTGNSYIDNALLTGGGFLDVSSTDDSLLGNIVSADTPIQSGGGFSTAPTPEPSSIALLASGLLGMAWIALRKGSLAQ